MQTEGISSFTKETNAPGFITLLSSAVCEWLLIFLMFVDAALSYFLTKLARYCELPAPCILCSRIEHILGHDKAGNYRNLLCNNHRIEISSLMSCHIHDRLADVHEMCEECFMSIVMQNKSNPESYRLLVGKLGLDFERLGSQGPLTSNNIIPDSSNAKPCSCCNKTWRSKSNVQRLLHLIPAGFGASRANVKPPLPRVPGRSRFSRRDSMRKMRDNFSGPIAFRHKGDTGVDPLSHVGYTELRITSDSESEFPFSDDDDVSFVARESIDPREHAFDQGGLGDLARAHANGEAWWEKSSQDSDSEVSVQDQFVQPDVSKPKDVKNSKADACTGERNSEQPNPKPTPSALPELISLDDIPSTNASRVPSGLSAERPKADVPQQCNVLEAPLEVSPEKNVARTGDIGNSAITKREQLSELFSTTTGSDIFTYANQLMPNDKDLNNFGKLALNSRGRELSGILAQQRGLSNYGKLEEDLKASTISPRAYGPLDGLRRSDILDGILTGQRAGSVERNESGYESLDGSVSEIEGESLLDKLKRQVEYDRKCMSSLCKELEEERSASTIAANQAMAMITRLQEEKAALHMEALQYLRMMEEQAEYDMDALEKANDLVAEKERDMQDLETELEFYRMNFSDESTVQKEENTIAGTHGVDNKNNAKNTFSNFTSTKLSAERIDPINSLTPVLDFEDEKLYISQCLKRLETKLHQAKNDELENGEKLLSDTMICTYDHKEENGSLSAHEGSVDLVGNNHFDSNRQKDSMHGGEILLDTIENEISDLNDRLEALETNRDFLEHAFNSLQNGNEGLQFIQDIAHELQELRKLKCRKCQPVP